MPDVVPIEQSPDIEPIRAYAEEYPAAVVMHRRPRAPRSSMPTRPCAPPPAVAGRAARPSRRRGLPPGPRSRTPRSTGPRERRRPPWACRAQPLRLAARRRRAAGLGHRGDAAAERRRPWPACCCNCATFQPSAAREAALHEALAAQQAIAREAEHRIKNSLATRRAPCSGLPIGAHGRAGRARGGGGGDRRASWRWRKRTGPCSAAPTCRSGPHRRTCCDELAAGAAVQHARHGPPHGGGRSRSPWTPSAPSRWRWSSPSWWRTPSAASPARVPPRSPCACPRGGTATGGARIDGCAAAPAVTRSQVGTAHAASATRSGAGPDPQIGAALATEQPAERLAAGPRRFGTRAGPIANAERRTRR